MSDVTIEIRTNPKLRPFRAAFFAGLQVAVIGIGVLTGSSAMQWAGFWLLAVMLIVAVIANLSKSTGLSFEEAREHINKLEAEEDRS